MADNKVLNAGSGGATVGTDEIAGVDYQRIKLILGDDGTNDGDVSSNNPLPVTGTVTANLGTVDNAVLDSMVALLTTIDADTSTLAAAVATEYQVDVVSSALPTGAATAANQSTTNGLLTTIDADTGNIATAVAAIQSAVETIDNVVATISATTVNRVAIYDDNDNQITTFGGSGGTSATDDGAFTAGSGAGTPIMGFATADSVDSGDVGVVAMTTGRAMHVAVQGTVTVDLGANNDVTLATLPDTSGGDLASMSADLGTIDTDTGNIAAGFATEGSALGSGVLLQGDDGTDRKNINVDATTGDVQVDVTNTVTVDLGVNNDVTLATLPDTSGGDLASMAADLGTIDADTGNIATSVALIDDAIFADNAAFTLSSSKVNMAGAIRDDTLSTLSAVEGDAVPLRVDSTGALHIAGAISGSVNIAPATSGGASLYSDNDIDETAVAVKASAGQVYSFEVTNFDATPVWLHFYNIAQGSVTVGTTTPTYTYAVPTSGDGNGAGISHTFVNGIEFDTAITIAVTTTVGGSAGPGTNECVINIEYA